MALCISFFLSIFLSLLPSFSVWPLPPTHPQWLQTVTVAPYHTQWHTRGRAHTHSRYDPSGRGIGPSQQTSTWQHTTLTRHRHPCLRRESNPQSQQTSDRRPCVTSSQGAIDIVCCLITLFFKQVLIIQLVCCSLRVGGTEVWQLDSEIAVSSCLSKWLQKFSATHYTEWSDVTSR